jgi:hypothetical protein
VKITGINEIDWKACQGLYVTANFANTVQVDDLSQYLRYADSMLVFEHQALLLSDREADGIFDKICKVCSFLSYLLFHDIKCIFFN